MFDDDWCCSHFYWRLLWQCCWHSQSSHNLFKDQDTPEHLETFTHRQSTFCQTGHQTFLSFRVISSLGRHDFKNKGANRKVEWNEKGYVRQSSSSPIINIVTCDDCWQWADHILDCVLACSASSLTQSTSVPGSVTWPAFPWDRWLIVT